MLNINKKFLVFCQVVEFINKAGVTVNSEVLARELKVERRYLESGLQALSRAELIVSMSGPAGGYRIADGVDEVTALDVYYALFGPVHPSNHLISNLLIELGRERLA